MTYKGKEVDQECLDQHLLRSKNESIRYYPGPGNKIFEAFYKLPDDLTCAQCVFQWRYVAGNNWGDCGNGTGIVRRFQRFTRRQYCIHDASRALEIRMRADSCRTIFE